jgi:hypothetical protein
VAAEYLAKRGALACFYPEMASMPLRGIGKKNAIFLSSQYQSVT